MPNQSVRVILSNAISVISVRVMLSNTIFVCVILPNAILTALCRAVNKGASHYKGVSQQQLLTALQDLKGGQADRSRHKLALTEQSVD